MNPPGADYPSAIRAPIIFHDDAIICNYVNGLDEAPQSSAWIAVEDKQSNHFVQIGFTKDNPVPGVGSPKKNCRFWANGVGFPHEYDCDTMADGTQVWFMIVGQQVSGDAYRYAISDCGTSGGYGSCSLKNFTEPLFVESEAAALGETRFACTDRLMGSSTAPVKYGNATYPLQAKKNITSSWATRSFAERDGCGGSVGYYQGSIATDFVKSWDSRN